MNIVSLHRQACSVFAEQVALVRDDQWNLPTPCAAWDVRALVNHVVGEDRWTAPLFEGQTIAEVGDRFDGDLLAENPLGACQAAVDEATAAVGEPGAIDRIVHLSFGDTPAREYVWQLFADHLIHAWDLARAIVADEHLDEELVASCATWFEPMEEAYRGAGAIAARPPVPADADAQTLLLARFGRRA